MDVAVQIRENTLEVRGNIRKYVKMLGNIWKYMVLSENILRYNKKIFWNYKEIIEKFWQMYLFNYLTAIKPNRKIRQ